MRHGSLFSGIGGFDLAAEWMGWENVFHCEWNEFGQKVLKYYWPNAISYGDITKTDFTIHRGQIDILTGGFPCQPYSTAGKRLGKEDDRHLWPEMLRAIREIAPRYIVGENVRGLISWNGGMVFDEVQTDLETCGYEVIPLVLPACAVNAPHRRDRVWFVAYTSGSGVSVDNTRVVHNGESNRNGEIWRETVEQGWPESISKKRISANPNSGRVSGLRNEHDEFSKNRQRRQNNEKAIHNDFMHTDSSSKSREHIGQEREGQFNRSNSRTRISDWSNFPTQFPICIGDDGISSRLDGITFRKWRNESIKAGGNAIVPQLALQIFKAIESTI